MDDMVRRPLPVIRGTLAVALTISLVTPLLAQHHNKHDERALKEDPRLAPGQLAPVLQDLGDHHHPITTQSERAQLFFDQGLKLTYGFNHQEALRSFKEAARLDPDCAMAYWGWALVLGPNLNLPMHRDVVAQAHEAIQMALERKGKVSEQERDYIDALARRYTDDPDADRAPLDAAYARAMAKLHARYPDDPDAATLYAAALMNLSPWNYWTRDGRPRENTPEILAALEGVMERDPEHEGALHYYIHAVEPVDPDRGVKAADDLRGLAPGAGHLTHMPSHIYMQVGRYADAFQSNTLAAKADEGYITQCRAQGIYPLNYYPHNVHFLAWAAMMQGRSAEAIGAARKVASKVPEDFRENNWALYQTFLSMPLYAMVRFAKWEEILEEPRPPEHTRYWTGIWHYARGMAYTHTDRVKEARGERTALVAIAEDRSTPEVLIGLSNAGTLLDIAKEVLSGEIAAKTGRHDEALGHLERGVRLQESLTYTEPPDWYYPVRHSLGAVLLEAGRPGEAESVYWQDLRQYRDNGYSLFGLWQSLKAQDKADEAAGIEKRFRRAWADADMKLTSSRY
jgi:tetratricopeptide (TPR) repeat protein